MEEVMKKLQDLAEALKNSPEYKGYVNAKDIIHANEELKKRLTEFKARQFKLQNIEFHGKKVDEHELKSLQAHYSEILLQKDLANFIHSEQKLTEMLSLCYKSIGQKIPLDLSFLGINSSK